MPATMPMNRGLAGGNKAGAGAGGNQPGEPAVGAKAGIGLAEADAGDSEGGGESRCRGEQSIDRGDGQGGRSGIKPQDRSGHIPGQPADQRDKAAEEDIDGVVARASR